MSHRPTEYYRLTLSSVLGQRLPPTRPTTIEPTANPTPTTRHNVLTAASVVYDADMGPVDTLHEGGEWGVLVESFVTGKYNQPSTPTVKFRPVVPVMQVEIPELSVGGQYHLVPGNYDAPIKQLAMTTTTNRSKLHLGTCVPASTIGPAVRLAQGGDTDSQSHQYMELPQSTFTRVKQGPYGLMNLTVNLLDERGNALVSEWTDDVTTNVPIPTDSYVSGTAAAQAQIGADYVMTLLFSHIPPP